MGVNLNRTENLLIAILAILKIGAVYLPLDADLPEKRLNLILNKAKVKFLISEFDAKKIKNIFKIVLNQKEIESQSKGNLNVRILPKDLAYLIFTSGSSGEPKGVKVAHASLLNFISGIKDAVGIRKNQKILSTTNVSFDIFFLESIASLCLNLTVILVDEKERLDPQKLKKIIIDKKVEIVQFTPSYLNILLDGKNTPEWLEGIKKILVGGEILSNTLFAQIKKIYKNQIFNMYGPTETSIWSSVADLTQGKNVNIGYPIANTQIYILDNDLNLCPFAVIGEIYISGQGLALGYLEDSETKKVFIANGQGSEINERSFCRPR